MKKGKLLFCTFYGERFKLEETQDVNEVDKKVYNIKPREQTGGRVKGLYRKHGYSILGVGEKVFPNIGGKNKTIKTIIIRNPHGRTGRQYQAEIDGKYIDDLFENPESMKDLTSFSSVKAVSNAKGNFSQSRKFHDLATGNDIEGSGIFEMELKDFIYHVRWFYCM